MSLSVAWEGGGSRGIANGGVYAALEQSRLLHYIQCAGGASIGALFALFTALRVPAADVIQRVHAINLKDFIGDRVPGKVGSSVRYMMQWGIYSAEPLFRFMQKLVADCMTRITGRASTGEETLRDIYNVHRCHILTTVTNVSTQQCVELNDVDHPHVPAYWAVALSMVIPLVFAPVKWGDHYWVDGGIANGLPYDGVCRLAKRANVVAATSASFAPTAHYSTDEFITDGGRVNLSASTPQWFASPVTPTMLHVSTPTVIVFAFDNDDPSLAAVRHHPPVRQTGVTKVSPFSWGDGGGRRQQQQRQQQATDTTVTRTPQHGPSGNVDSLVDYIAHLFQTLNKSRGLATFMHEFNISLPHVLLLPTPGVSTLSLDVDATTKQQLIDASYQRTMQFLQPYVNMIVIP